MFIHIQIFIEDLLCTKHKQGPIHIWGFPCSSAGKESACNAGDTRFNSWVGKIPWRRDRLPTSVFIGFPGGSDSKESACNEGDLDSIPGLGRCLEEGMETHSSILAWRISMDRGAWWATVHGVAKWDMTEQLQQRQEHTYMMWLP